MAIYYVKNSGDDGLDGLSEGNAWQTVNKVNTSTFQPGDSVLFERGGEWREALTVPSSGTSDNYIVFGAYGTGNNPRLNGSTQLVNADFTKDSDLTVPAFSCTPNVNQADAAVRNYRWVITAVNSANNITVSFKASDSAAFQIGGAGIGAQLSGTTAVSMTRILFDGGSSTTTIAAGGTKASDSLAFNVVAGKKYLVHVYMTARNYKYTSSGIPADLIAYTNTTAADQSVDASVTMTASGNSCGVETITSDLTIPLYSIALGTDPIDVTENDCFFQKKTTAKTNITTVGQYYWNGSTTLYLTPIYGTNPATNTAIYEIYGREYCIWDNSKSYVEIKNIDCKSSFNANAQMGGIVLTGTSNLCHDLSTWCHRRHCFSFYGAGAPWSGYAVNCVGYNLNIFDCVDTSEVTIYPGNTTGNILRNSNIFRTTKQRFISSAGILVRSHGGAVGNTVDTCRIWSDLISDCTMVDVYDADTSLTVKNSILESRYVGQSKAVITLGTSNRCGNISLENNLVIAKRVIGNDSITAAGISFYNCAGATITGNTFIFPSMITGGIRLDDSPNVKFRNNIIYSPYIYNITDAASQVGFLSENNLFYYATIKWRINSTDYTTLATWQAASGYDSTSNYEDPLFKGSDDFHLQSTSPGIGLGYNWPRKFLLEARDFR